jgi:hypothetical protein
MRKMLHAPALLVHATAVRVPVLVGHSVSLALSLRRAATPEEARRVLSAFPGSASSTSRGRASTRRRSVRRASTTYSSGACGTFRRSRTGLSLFASGENLRKGNAPTPCRSPSACSGSVRSARGRALPSRAWSASRAWPLGIALHGASACVSFPMAEPDHRGGRAGRRSRPRRTLITGPTRTPRASGPRWRRSRFAGAQSSSRRLPCRLRMRCSKPFVERGVNPSQWPAPVPIRELVAGAAHFGLMHIRIRILGAATTGRGTTATGRDVAGGAWLRTPRKAGERPRARAHSARTLLLPHACSGSRSATIQQLLEVES